MSATAILNNREDAETRYGKEGAPATCVRFMKHRCRTARIKPCEYPELMTSCILLVQIAAMYISFKGA